VENNGPKFAEKHFPSSGRQFPHLMSSSPPTTGFPTAKAEVAALKVVCGYDPPPLESHPAELDVIVGRKRRSDTREVDLKIKIPNKKPRLE